LGSGTDAGSTNLPTSSFVAAAMASKVLQDNTRAILKAIELLSSEG
jgi:hypothetical protein